MSVATSLPTAPVGRSLPEAASAIDRWLYNGSYETDIRKRGGVNNPVSNLETLVFRLGWLVGHAANPGPVCPNWYLLLRKRGF